MYIEPYTLEEEDNNIYKPPQYKQLMLNNNKEKLYKVGLSENTPIYTEGCFDKCDDKSCKIMYERKKNLDKCLQCNSNEKKCFRKSITGGNCDDCMDNEKQIDCLDIYNYGCVPPNNLNLVRGVDPYFIQIPDNNPNSLYDQKCVFCWNILNGI
jgi:hypothetical protein